MAQLSGERANVRLFAAAESAQEAEVMLGALEVGCRLWTLHAQAAHDGCESLNL